LIVVYGQLSHFSTLSRREQVNLLKGDDEKVHFVLDQQEGSIKEKEQRLVGSESG
jgi:hypothetical protein